MPQGQPNFYYKLLIIKGLLKPPLHVTHLPEGIVVERDVEVTMRDGTILRVNVFRPQDADNHPVIMSAHPYEKDKLPKKGLFGYRPLIQYRLLRQPTSVSFSEFTAWESPDPAFWVPRGYVVVNIDLRGFGKSEGKGNLLSDQEANDYYDVIEWAGTQPWSNGKVGLNGVSYLAMSQYKVAALRPPHLAAICPWEGVADFYKDFACPGGVREDGFVPFWSKGVAFEINPREEQLKRPLRDEWYKSLVADLKRIEVPALICGSFSDHNLHTRGSFRVFREISSKYKWLYTHRGGKWAEFYSTEALEFQEKFFDYFLKGKENRMLEVPPIRLEVRDTRDVIHEVRTEREWPLPSTDWTVLFLNAGTGQLSKERPSSAEEIAFDNREGEVKFEWSISEDMEITGPMKLKLHLQVQDTADVNIFAGIRKLRDDKHVIFEGSYGFAYDMVTNGWLKASLRKLDEANSELWRPTHTFDTMEPLKPGQTVELDIALLPSATFFKKGDVMRLDIQGRWFFKHHMIFGTKPDYEKSPEGKCTLFSGGEFDSHLLVPIIKKDHSG